ncbi:hypothetical protein CEUSTIGMA_g10330.t1 [Chlamydomonas eustigma]|uniref:Uncharacterized protein n=1 Tax=Chlamydomonas eustigma TaxID=1157962 RepID=A0A250XIK3_9CHLO|nr:hypothetical protein CEUSTIGMA_g10330.t1 [Chlamydomonas eustigma]|eukprot:GAX82904.1 hypothetical protein CEUSTIGMA_g10330.t1 [Chlamydomonas eustigma]
MRAPIIAATFLFPVMLFLLCYLNMREKTYLFNSNVNAIPKSASNSKRNLRLYEQRVSFFSDCGYKGQPSRWEDWTSIFKSTFEVQNTCVSNPSVIILESSGDTILYLLTARLYWSWNLSIPCVSPDSEGGPWFEYWKGKGGLAMLVIRKSLEAADAPVEVLSSLLTTSDTEDARLFKDSQGKIRMLYNRWHGGDESMRGFKRLQHRSMHVSEVVVDAAAAHQISIVNDQEIIYVYQGQDEKNWVPWEGTALMTYPNYPLFAPHTVLDWETYDMPQDQLSMKAVTPVPFMEKFKKATGGWFRFSGGTPGIRLDENRFVAVGHSVGDLSCFHKEVKGARAVRKLVMDIPDSTLKLTDSRFKLDAHSCNSTYKAPEGHREWKHHFDTLGHHIDGHHPYWEYFFFIYAWSAHYPYKITHISNSFIPHDALEHRGVYFPTGLQLIPQTDVDSAGQKRSPGLLLTFGKDDNKAMSMKLGSDVLEEYLEHISTVDPQAYKFCAVRVGAASIVTHV